MQQHVLQQARKTAATEQVRGMWAAARELHSGRRGFAPVERSLGEGGS